MPLDLSKYNERMLIPRGAVLSIEEGGALNIDRGAVALVDGEPAPSQSIGAAYDGGDGSALPDLPAGTLVWLHATWTPADVTQSEGPITVLTAPKGFVPLTFVLEQIVTPADSGTDSDVQISNDADIGYSLTVLNDINPRSDFVNAGQIQGAPPVGAPSNLAGGLSTALSSADGNPMVNHIQVTYTVSGTPGETKPVIYVTVLGALLGLRVPS